MSHPARAEGLVNMIWLFSSHFCFQVSIVFLSGLVLLMLLFADVSNLLCFFNAVVESLCWYIDRVLNVSESSNPFVDMQSLSSLGCKAKCIVINFLVLCSIRLSSSLVLFKMVILLLAAATVVVSAVMVRDFSFSHHIWIVVNQRNLSNSNSLLVFEIF